MVSRKKARYIYIFPGTRKEATMKIPSSSHSSFCCWCFWTGREKTTYTCKKTSFFCVETLETRIMIVWVL